MKWAKLRAYLTTRWTASGQKNDRETKETKQWRARKKRKAFAKQGRMGVQQQLCHSPTAKDMESLISMCDPENKADIW